MNFQITQGTGTTIGTDQVAGTNFQQIKLIDATAGSPLPVGTDANPLRVSLEFTQTNANPLSVTGDITPNPPSDRPTSGVMAASIDQVIVDCTGVTTLGWTTSGNWIGTMTHEVQYGDGQWFIVETIDTNLADDGKPFVVTQWTQGLNNDPWITNVAGATQLRFRFISYVSGSATVTTNGSVRLNAVRVYNTTPSVFQTTSLIKDSDNNDLTSTAGALDVNLKTSDITLTVSGSGDFTVVQPTGTNLHAVVDSGSITVANATLAVTQSGVWSVGRTWALTSGTDSVASIQSGVWNVNAIQSGAWSTGRTWTLASGTDSIASIQSGVWSTGRTWTLASGTDSIAATQSGTWNINNISGTVSLPTGAATETTLSTRLADATFTARINTLGQKTMANSTPVVLASDQSAIPASQSGTWNINNVSGTVSLPTGASTAANQTNASQKTQIVDGSGNVIASTAVGGVNYLDVSLAASGTPAAAIPVRTVLVGGSDGTNLRSIATDTTGKVKVDLNDGAGTAITSTTVGAVQGIDVNQVQNADGYAAQQNQVFAASFDFNLPTGGTETPALFLKNPSGSGKTLVIKRILVSGVSTGNNEAVAALYSNPTTAGDGTGQAETTTSVGSGATSVATAFSGPNVVGGANGARFLAWQVPAAANNTPSAPPIVVDGLIRIAPNNTLLLTGKPAANNMNVAWSIFWQEV